MATLAEGLTIKVGADVRDLKKGMKDAEQQTKKSTDKMKKDTKGLIDRLDGVRNEWEKIRGVALFATAAFVAAAVPMIKAQDALTKMGSAAKIAGESLEGTTEIVNQKAEQWGTTIASAAETARNALVRGLDPTEALDRAGIAKKLEGIGFGAAAGTEKATLRLKRALGSTTEEAARLGVQMSVVSEADAMNIIANEAVRLKPLLDASGVSMQEFAEQVGAIQQSGIAGLGQAIGLVETFLKEIQSGGAIAAAQELGLNIDEIDRRVNGLGETLSLMAQAAKREGAPVAELVGNMQAFQDILASIDASVFLEAIGSANRVATTFQDTLGDKSWADQIKESLASIERSLDSLIDWVQKAINKFNELKQAGPEDIFRFLLGGDAASGIISGNLQGMADGGSVPGQGNSDSVPALLTPGEFVVRKEVAEATRPLLMALNQQGVNPRFLKNTMLAGSLVKGHPLLEMLELERFGNTSRASHLSSSDQTRALATAASRILDAVNSIQFFARGGPVQKFAGGGPVEGGDRGTTINNTFNVSGTSFNEAFVRRSILPLIERVQSRGQSRRGRTGR